MSLLPPSAKTTRLKGRSCVDNIDKLAWKHTDVFVLLKNVVLQSVFRGYRVRKTFSERKRLLMKHEQLKKEVAR